MNGSVSKAAPGMAEVPGTSSETITETVETSTPPPPQQVNNDGGLVVNTFWTVLPAEHEAASRLSVSSLYEASLLVDSFHVVSVKYNMTLSALLQEASQGLICSYH